ncbi:family 43 glycosylhydrolase [Cellvibrio sp. NN19]|uniref:family 43 glycosylhydrolase n=1 Tax=Cellvibrio chitinivorans TaxID=3102792 RepID=UPI002B4007AD|nr:family 43 glycosylhydrolase [Cellvibrio sp. NN19]
MRALLTSLLLPIFLLSCATKDSAPEKEQKTLDANTFTNPIYPNGADPWLEYFDGNYYLTTTTWTSQLVMRKSPTLAGLASATPIHIWSESELERCCNFWAFEFHRLKTEKGYRWYVMYTSGIAENYDRQHLSVIESQGDDPLGPYTYKGSPMPDTWNIDGNYLEYNGQLYLLWSEWVKDEQSIFVAKMVNPWTITGEKVLISKPDYEWEKSGMKVNEGPEILKRNGRTFMIYSASFCNTPDYKLGLIELTGDPLKPESWKKSPEPVFSKANGVYGPGHNGFFKSPDGTEDWLIYHGNASEKEGCSATRSLRAQKFTWNADDTPNFGEPVAAGEPVISPAGENGPLVTKVQGTQVQLVSKANQQCVSFGADGKIAAADCKNVSASNWVLDYTTNGNYRLVNKDGKFLGQGGAACSAGKTDALNIAPWHNQLCQQWQLVPHDKGWSTLVNVQSKQELHFGNCVEPAVVEGKKSVEDVPQFIEQKSACNLWRVQPTQQVAITSVQSGKAISVAGVTKAGANIEQDEWNNKSTQRWSLVSSQEGYYYIQSVVDPKLCVSIANKSIVPGSNAELAACGDVHTQWQVDFLSDGTVKLANRKSNLVLDLAHCGVANHTNFAQGQWLNSNCQRFQIKPIQ